MIRRIVNGARRVGAGLCGFLGSLGRLWFRWRPCRGGAPWCTFLSLAFAAAAPAQTVSTLVLGVPSTLPAARLDAMSWSLTGAFSWGSGVASVSGWDLEGGGPPGGEGAETSGPGGEPPVLVGFVPGGAAPSALLQLEGVRLAGATEVRIGGAPAVFRIVSDTRIEATVPGAAQDGPVTVTAPSGTAEAPFAFSRIDPPGPPELAAGTVPRGTAGGTLLLEGRHFQHLTNVTVGGRSVTARVLGGNRVYVTLPRDMAGERTLVMSGVEGVLSVPVTLAPLPPAPEVAEASPRTGRAGDPVILLGRHLGLATQVTFQGMAATFVVLGPNQVRAVVPEGARTGVLRVTTPGGTGISPFDFTVVQPPPVPEALAVEPAEGRVGSEIRVFGVHVGRATRVVFGDAPAEFRQEHDGALAVTVPAGKGAVLVRALDAQGQGTGGADFRYIETATPRVTAVTWDEGAEAGTLIAVRGSGFEGVREVLIQGMSAPFAEVQPGELRVWLPLDAAPGPLVLVGEGGRTRAADRVPVTPSRRFPAVTGLQPSSGKPGDLVTLRGWNLAGTRAVRFSGVTAAFEILDAGTVRARVPSGVVPGAVTVHTDVGVGTAPTRFAAIGFDTTLMGDFDILTAPKGASELVVASPELEPGESRRLEFATDVGLGNWRTVREWTSSGDGGAAGPFALALGDASAGFVRALRSGPCAANWGFECGLTGWSNAPGTGVRQPVAGRAIHATRVRPRPAQLGGDYWHTPFPIGAEGDFWLSTAHDPDASGPLSDAELAQRDERVATLYSPEFPVDGDWISFLIGGQRDTERLTVSLEVRVEGSEEIEWIQSRLGALGRPVRGGIQDGWMQARSTAAHGGDELMRTFWSVNEHRGRTARIVIRDRTSQGHLNVDDFRFGSGALPLDSLMLARDRSFGGTTAYYRDVTRPVWGVADTHTHPAGHLGFGGLLVAGEPTGAISNALASCDGPLGARGLPGQRVHGIAGTGICPGGDCGNPGLNLFEGTFGHRTSGWDNDFDGWPSIVSVTHQSMHESWIRRAHAGGLRLMVAHVVNTELVGRVLGLLGGPRQPVDDVSQVEVQVAGIQALVARNADVMEIALSPRQARDIIHRGKLAVVLGVEQDAWGGFVRDGTCTDDEVRGYLDHLYRSRGIRHMFPVHLSDNAMGGFALYSELWNINNLAVRGDFVGVVPAPAEIEFRMPDASALARELGRALTEEPDVSPAIIFEFIANPAGVVEKLFTQIAVRGLVQAAVAVTDAASRPYPAGVGHVNSLGLTDRGREAIRHMMRLGMIIDTDHMGMRLREGVLAEVEPRGYPLIAGHTGFNALGWGTNTTSDLKHKVRSEGELLESTVVRLRALGGMVSPILLAKDLRHGGGVISNDCPGSAKSWLQSYEYALRLMGGTNVGLGTDYTLTHMSGPRFGYEAAWGLASRDPTRPGPARRAYADAQRNGVRYDRPLRDFRLSRLRFTESSPSVAEEDRDKPGTPDPLYELDERLYWAALFAHGAGLDAAAGTREIGDDLGAVADDHFSGVIGDLLSFDPVTVVRGVVERAAHAIDLRTNRRTQVYLMLTGLAATSLDAPEMRAVRFFEDNPQVPQPPYSRAVWYVRRGEAPPATEDPRVASLYPRLLRVHRLWQEMVGGSNPPLQRHAIQGRTRFREFDVNLDGMAHFGMLPDFLQDCRNAGMSEAGITPLFQSAEAYIRLWERCEARRLR